MVIKILSGYNLANNYHVFAREENVLKRRVTGVLFALFERCLRSLKQEELKLITWKS